MILFLERGVHGHPRVPKVMAKFITVVGDYDYYLEKKQRANGGGRQNRARPLSR